MTTPLAKAIMVPPPQSCALCEGSGENISGIVMRVNNHVCPRCGGYGTIPSECFNPDRLTEKDRDYAESNGIALEILPL